MNINEQLRRAHNVIKFGEKDWSERLAKEEETSEFYAPYFFGALAASEILIHIWSGNLSDRELEQAIRKLKEPIERKIN